MDNPNLARRRLLRFFAASPLLLSMGPARLLAAALAGPEDLPDSLLKLVTSPDEALDVFDFQRVAKNNTVLALTG